MNRLKVALVIAALSALVGCGGGGSSAGTSVFTPSSSASSPAAGASAPAPAASALVISLNKNEMHDIASDTVVATITAIDANRNAIPDAPISVAVDGNAIVHVSGQAADANGNVTATISPGQDLSNRAVTITATSGSITQKASFQVIGAQVNATVTPGGVLTVGEAASVRVVVTDFSANPLPGQTVKISGDGIAAGSGTTGPNGDFTYSFSAPATPGALNLTLSAAGSPANVSLQVQEAGGSTPPAIGTVLSPSVSANPAVVSVNAAGSTSNQTTVSAVFVGANNARIKNIRVRFDLDGDANSVGGTFASDGAMLYSDGNGVASTSYAPGVISSPTNGVTVRACWDYNDFAAGTCPNQATTTLTVVAQALKVSIGTDNTIEEHSQTFFKDYVVVVNDAAGQAAKGVVVTPSLDLTAFYKGEYNQISTGGSPAGVWYFHDNTGDGPYAWNGSGWTDHFGDPNTIPACPNEDHNRNGVLESGEDLNHNGKLDPSGVTITALDASGNPVSGGYPTDASGLMRVRIEYPQNYAGWIDYAITVTAKVAATEGKAVFSGTLPTSSTQLNNPLVPPSFGSSPFGVDPGCTNAK
jgi:hypothetical protein